MTHPSFEILTEFAGTGKPDAIKEHVENCERCTTMVEGIEIALIESKKKQIPTVQFFQESKEKVKTTVTKERLILESNSGIRSSTYRVAAAISAIVLGTVIYFYVNTFDANEFVTFQIVNNRPNPNVERNLTTDQLWSSFVKEYQQEQYWEALSTLNKYDITKKNSSTEFFKGLCYLYLKIPQYDRAIQIFDKLSNSDSRFREQAKWYLGLSYYKIGELEKSKSVLYEIIAVEDHFKTDEAQKLLEAMN